MAQRPRKLTVRLSQSAERSLIRIWIWNANLYDEAHADAYRQFLMSGTRSLEKGYSEGRPVPDNLGFRYITLRRNPRGHGHVVVYRVSDQAVDVIDYFHTAQDWQAKVRDEPD